MRFYHNPSETVTNLSFSTGTINDIQSAINSTRSSYPNNIIRITITGTFTVTDAPLQLGSFMLLILNNATIQAASNVTATSLIAVSSSEYVSIGSTWNGVLEGNNAAVTAIAVTTCGKTHIDNLAINDCTNAGVLYKGNGASVYADAGSITRCTISNCGSVGIHFSSAFNFVCTDNTIQTCTTGIMLNGNNAAVANNTISKCTTGIIDSSEYEALTYNAITSCSTGISLASTSFETLVAHNAVTGNSVGFVVNSTKASIYYNTCSNTTQVSGSGSNNQLFCNLGITSTQGNVSSCTYFNPPLMSNLHNDFIKIGKSRYDVNIGPLSFGMLRCVLDMIHGSQPNSVIVAHLSGTYTAASSTDSFLIKDDECILLNGTFNGNVSCGTLLNFSGSLTSSFSGGTIDGETNNGTSSLVYIMGSANVVINGVSIHNSAGQGIYKQNSTVPTFINGCTISNCASRDIWSLASSRLFAFENTISGSIKYDGIDLDAFSTNAVIIKNIISNNKRNGIFIEEGANNHIVQANTLDSNATAGLEFYNLNVNNATSSDNLIAENYCKGNYRGILVNASASTKATINNVLFNNTCINSTDVGVGGYYNSTNTYYNYNALMNIQNNTNGSYYSTRDYSANYDWNMY